MEAPAGQGIRYTRGFDRLRELDDNADSIIDASDASYANLRIWRDLNTNGVSDCGGGSGEAFAEHGGDSNSDNYLLRQNWM